MAEATDLLSLAEGRTAVNLGSSTNQDTELAQFISGISGRIDALCGPVVGRTITDEAHDGGKARIWFDFTPVLSVSTVTEYRQTEATSLTAETNASKPTDSYLLDRKGLYYYAWRRNTGVDSTYPAGRRNIVTTYTAGRYADTASVDEQFKLAAASVLRRIWHRESSIWAQSPDWSQALDNPGPSVGFFKAVDPMIKELLADQLLPPVGL